MEYELLVSLVFYLELGKVNIKEEVAFEKLEQPKLK